MTKPLRVHHSIPAEASGAFRGEVLAYYREHGRRLPWRATRDPYAIVVSEVMLQQTQVPRVEGKYEPFLEAFPDFGSLGTAPLAAVLEAWSPLGYNRRAVNLKRIAEIVVSRYDARLPDDPAILASLPGIGRSTAAAIACYAFGESVPFIETNVRAVFLHYFFAGAEDVPDGALMPLVEATWDRDDPRAWGYALMDYGSWLKRQVPNVAQEPAPQPTVALRGLRSAGTRRVPAGARTLG
jgi:A/G-specific adenine glycosylase